jgi:hypothetical protein
MPSPTTAAPTNLGPKVAANVHPVYALLKQQWIDLGHVREGVGGFLDGAYLRAHPREWLDHTVISQDPTTGISVARTNPRPRQPSPKLIARRALARYENVASAILQAKKAVLFRDAPSRRVGDGNSQTPSPIEQWWENVDGNGTHINDAVPMWWDLAATFGHVVLYFYQPTIEGALTAADDAMPYVRVYTPLDVLNWLTDDDGCITSIKVMEAKTPTTYEQMTTTYQVRVIDEDQSTVYDYKSGKAEGASVPHGLGRLPVVFLYGKRRSFLADVGESVLGDPKNYIDLYNLTSEVRELLRAQTFSLINVPLGTGDGAQSVEEAQTMMGKQTGSMNVLFSAQQAAILTGDPSNVESYHAEIERLKRDVYRETGVQWQTDTKDAEAQGSLEIKREEMNTRIAMYADECQRTEYELIDCFYRAKFGADRSEQKQQDDKVTVHYPDRFTVTNADDVVKQTQAAMALGFPPEVMKELRKKVLRELIDSDAPEDLFKKLDAAIDASDDEAALANVRGKLTSLLQGGKQPGAPSEPTPVDPPKAAA